MTKEIEIKHEKVKRLLTSRKLSGLLLAKQSNLHWFTGGKMNNIIKNEDISLIYLYITEKKKYLLATNSDNDRMMDEELAGLGFESVFYNWYDQSVFDALGKIHKPSAIGADINFPDTIMMQDEISNIRRSLTPHEIERFRKLVGEHAKILTDFCLRLKPGLSEREIAAKFTYQCSLLGIRLPVLMIGGDDRAYKYRHPAFTDNIVKKHILFATVGEKDGLYAPTSRVIHFGNASEELKSKMDAANYVESFAAHKSFPGTALKDIFEAIKEAYKRKGFDGEWKNHTQGGLTNYKPCEYIIDSHSEIKLIANEAISFNPTIAGVKAEDTYIITEDGTRQISGDKRWPRSEILIEGKKFFKSNILEL